MKWTNQEQQTPQPSPDAEVVRLAADWYEVPVSEVTPGMVTAHAARLLAWTLCPQAHPLNERGGPRR